MQSQGLNKAGYRTGVRGSSYHTVCSLIERLLYIPGPVLAPLASLLAQIVKNLPAVRETQVQFLGRADPLEKGMASHSSILAWKISWTEDPGALQSMGLQRVGND